MEATAETEPPVDKTDRPARSAPALGYVAPPEAARLGPPPSSGPADSPAPSTRWVLLHPETPPAAVGGAARSGAFLMVATRPETERPAVTVPSAFDHDLRSALVSCVEALLPSLEHGWSECREHPTCRAVQEAAAVLWGDVPHSPGRAGLGPPAPEERAP